jgi:hypothetical protein
MAPDPDRSAERESRSAVVLRHPITLWGAFLVVHIVLGYLCLNAPGLPFGDVTLVYKPWAQQAETGIAVVGINAPWVYPPLALVPIMLPLLAGPDLYGGAWLVMVLLLDAVAFAVLTVRRGSQALIAAWWWLGFLLVLGPIAIARLDAVSVAVVIVALLWLRSRPTVAAVLLAVATWIKVWPAALIGSVFVVSRQRWRMLTTVLATGLVVVILGLTFGTGLNVFSFITQQTGRGLQIEAPVSAPWMWGAAAHRPGTFVYYDHDILTFQVTGPGIDTAIALMTPLLGIVLVAILLVGFRATTRGAPALAVLPSLSLALVTALIAFNKVGSPQYVAWLAAPVILGIVCGPRAFRTPAILAAITAALTQFIYPYLYDWLLVANGLMVTLLSIRNAMFFVILGWALWALWRSARTAQPAADLLDVSDATLGVREDGVEADPAGAASGMASAEPSAEPSGSAAPHTWPFTVADRKE